MAGERTCGQLKSVTGGFQCEVLNRELSTVILIGNNGQHEAPIPDTGCPIRRNAARSRFYCTDPGSSSPDTSQPSLIQTASVKYKENSVITSRETPASRTRKSINQLIAEEKRAREERNKGTIQIP